MRHMRIKRVWNQRQALAPMGISTNVIRPFAGQVRTQLDDTRIMSLPVDIRYQTVLQNPDGTPAFMYGYSPYGTQ